MYNTTCFFLPIILKHTDISHKDLSLSYDASDSIGVKDLILLTSVMTHSKESKR